MDRREMATWRDLRGLPPILEVMVEERVRALAPFLVDGIKVEVTVDGIKCCVDERTHTITFGHLTKKWQLSDLNLDDDTQVVEAVTRWVGQRPVTDKEALTNGYAAIRWDASHPKWTVFVCRNTTVTEWARTLHTGTQAVTEIRAAAVERSQKLNHDIRQVGEMKAWTHRVHRAFSSSLLLNTQWLFDMAVLDQYVVLSLDDGVSILTGSFDDANRLQETTLKPVLVAHAAKPPELRWN